MPALLYLKANYATRSTKISFCQPERKFGQMRYQACDVLDVGWSTVAVFHSTVGCGDIRLHQPHSC